LGKKNKIIIDIFGEVNNNNNNMTTILFAPSNKLSYIGRNGLGKQVGIEILACGDSVPSQIVTMSPINGKNMVANCSIDLPVENIPDFIKALQEIHAKANKK